jgi:hypothetical protein
MELREVWKPIPGHEGQYEVSNLGRVRSLRHQSQHRIKLLKPWLDSHGYQRVTLCGKKSLVSRLVLATFRGLEQSRQVCRHLDGCKTNNRLDNLAWGTHLENRADALAHGTLRAVLTPAAVRGIRCQRDQGRSLRDIADCFGVSNQMIHKVLSGQCWREVV